jgi:hypothetical protein
LDRYRKNSGLLVMSGVAFSLLGSGLLWAARPAPGSEQMAIFDAHLKNSLGISAPKGKLEPPEKVPPQTGGGDWPGENYLSGCRGCPERPGENTDTP